MLKQRVTVRFGEMKKIKQKRERLEIVHAFNVVVAVSALTYSFERRLVKYG